MSVAAEHGPLLELASVGCRHGGALLLDRVSLAVARAELLGIIGPSGAGKTALLDLICGLLPASEGEVRLDGRRLGRRPDRIARRGIARSFERPSRLAGATVLEALALAAALAEGGRLDALLTRPDAPLSRHRWRAMAVLERLGLHELADHPPRGLDLPVRARLELARALVALPRLLLLDQPFRGLDTGSRAALADVVRALNQDGLTILLVEHDLALVGALCPRVVVLEHGEKIADGPPERVGEDPAVLHAFAGTTAP